MTSSSDNKLLIIGYVWPEPNSSAAGTRMMQLIRLFQQQQWQICFASPANLGEHRQDLTALGVDEQQIQVNDTGFDQFVSELRPDVVIFDRFMMEEQFGWRVEKHCPNALRILNTEDLHSLRDARHQIVKNSQNHSDKNSSHFDLSELELDNPTRLFASLAGSDLAKREIAAIFRSDITLMISEFEIQLLRQCFQVPASLLCYLPFQFTEQDTLEYINETQTFEQRQHFISIGNFRHAPNWDAVLWLKQEIWPLIRQQLPQAELHIYGAYLPPKASALNKPKQGFMVKGWAEDAQQVMQQARICLAPLRFGAGIKGKLADAMRCGTPSITTLIGAESMQANQSTSVNVNTCWPGAIANNAEEFAKQAVDIYSDATAWQQAQNLGYQWFKKNYTESQYSLDFYRQLLDTQQRLSEHRQNNFIGAMLNHHHHKSTQYMAQWIEAKNANSTKN